MDDAAELLTVSRARRIAKWTAIGVLSLVVLIALLLAGCTAVLARVPSYRAQMQHWLSDKAKLDIQFESLRAGWRGYGPELRFTQAVVRSGDAQRVLAVADKGSVGFDLWQAIRTGHLAAARLVLEGTELKAQRRKDGGFEVIGQADWPEFESQTKFEWQNLPVGVLSIRDVRLSFRDLQTGRGPWTLDQVTLDIQRDVRGGDDVMALQGSAKLPAALGKALSFSATGHGRLAEVATYQWQAEVVGTQLDLAGWAQVMPTDWFAPRAGVGSFKFAATVVGATPQQVSGQLNFVDVSVQPPQWQIPLPVADPLQGPVDEDLPAQATPAQRKATSPSVNPVNQQLNSLSLASNAATQASAQSSSVAATAALPVMTAAPLQYSTIALEFTATRNRTTHEATALDGVVQDWALQVRNWQLSRPEKTWPAGTAQAQLRFVTHPDIDQTPRRSLLLVDVRTEQMVLDNLWPLLAYLPENEANARLRALNVSGTLQGLALRYERDAADAAPRYGMRTRFTEVGVAPVARTPGVIGLSGSVEATGARGVLQLDSNDLALSMPRVFRTPLPLDKATGAISWQRDASGVHLRSEQVQVSNANGRAEASFTLDIPNAGSPVIEMHAIGTDLDAASAPRYTPAGIMHAKTLAWLDAAFPKGIVTKAEATLSGPLRYFPFRNNEGLFLIKAHIAGLTMNYQPEWRAATQLDIDAEFRNQGLTAVLNGGEVNGLQLVSGRGSIKDYHDSEISVSAKVQGSLDNALQFVQRSPVGPMIGEVFQGLSGRGQLVAQNELWLPLKEPSKRRIDIDVQLSGARVQLADINEPINNLNGTLHIRNDAVTAANLRGEFLQGGFVASAEPVAATNKSQFNIVATGQAQSAGVPRMLRWPAWVKLSGMTAYRFTMPGYPARDAQGVRRLYSIDSNLQGMTVDMPAPLRKSANAARALHLDADMQGNELQQIRVAAGDLRGLLRLKRTASGFEFDRAGVRADAIAASLPTQPGLRVEGRLNELVLDDWLKLDSASSAVTTGNANNSADKALQEVLRAANVSIDQFRFGGFVWPQVRAVLQATDAGWRVDVAGDQATGQVVVPYRFDAGRPVVLTMEHLSLQNEATGLAVKGAAKSELDPRELPAIRADVQRFQYGEHDFGHLQATVARSAQGLQSSDVRIRGNSFTGNGSGSWLQSGAAAQTNFKFTLESTDVRATMQQFNYGDFIAAKSGKLIADLRWPGGLDENVLARASGSFEFQVNDGQLLNVQPGAGRVLGLLSVAALPRRLSLDFRDVTDKGLAFDAVHADFVVTNGDARTQNMLLRGPSAEIGIVGRLGLGARDYDQTAVVTGDVSGALTGASVVAGGPVLGAAVLLFSQLFKAPLKGVARAYYHIGGTWDEPKVERIDADVAKSSLSASEAQP